MPGYYGEKLRSVGNEEPETLKQTVFQANMMCTELEGYYPIMLILSHSELSVSLTLEVDKVDKFSHRVLIKMLIFLVNIISGLSVDLCVCMCYVLFLQSIRVILG